VSAAPASSSIAAILARSSAIRSFIRTWLIAFEFDDARLGLRLWHQPEDLRQLDARRRLPHFSEKSDASRRFRAGSPLRRCG
jgi:hypothetical protein